MPKVLVTDAPDRAALAIIRSLGRKGVEVTAGHYTGFNAGFLSKYCRFRIIYPSPLEDYKKFLRYMLKLVKREKYDLLIPVTVFTTIPLSKHKEEFEPYVKVSVPSYDTMSKAFDKAQTIKVAAKHGIPHPKTIFVKDVEDVKAIAREMEYPTVIKPRTKVMWTNNSARMMKVTQRNYAYTPNDLVTKYTNIVLQNKDLIRSGCLPMIQEYVPGTGYGVEALFHNSEPKAVFIHKRLREYPTTGGASTLRVGVKNEKLRKMAIKVLRLIDWEGVAMVEFKVNEEDGDPILMEVNGRFWGSLPLAIASGVDFPYLLYKMIVDRNVVAQFYYRVGVKRRWLLPGDLLWLFSSLIDNSNRLRVLGEFLKSFSIPDDTFSIDDPLPSFGTIGTTLRLLTNLAGYRKTFGEIF